MRSVLKAIIVYIHCLFFFSTVSHAPAEDGPSADPGEKKGTTAANMILQAVVIHHSPRHSLQLQMVDKCHHL